MVDLWSGEESRHVLQVAIELYVEAQHGDNLETRIATAHNLLELLAWHWLVRERGLDADLVDRKRSSSWRVRRMLREIGVPTVVPAAMSGTRSAWPGADGPKVVCDLRNLVIHPKDLNILLAIPADTKLEVLRLAMWFADLAILRLLGHDGSHLNRTGDLPIFEGVGEPMPWAGGVS